MGRNRLADKGVIPWHPSRPSSLNMHHPEPLWAAQKQHPLSGPWEQGIRGHQLLVGSPPASPQLFSGNVFVWPKLCQERGGKGFVCLEAGSQGTRAISSTQADRWVTSYGPSACTRGKTGRAWGSEGRGLITCHPVPFPAFISLILSLMGHARNAGCGKGFEKHAWR